MVTPINEKPVRKPLNILIDSEALHTSRSSACKKDIGRVALRRQ